MPSCWSYIKLISALGGAIFALFSIQHFRWEGRRVGIGLVFQILKLDKAGLPIHIYWLHDSISGPTHSNAILSDRDKFSTVSSLSALD